MDNSNTSRENLFAAPLARGLHKACLAVPKLMSTNNILMQWLQEFIIAPLQWVQQLQNLLARYTSQPLLPYYKSGLTAWARVPSQLQFGVTHYYVALFTKQNKLAQQSLKHHYSQARWRHNIILLYLQFYHKMFTPPPSSNLIISMLVACWCFLASQYFALCTTFFHIQKKKLIGAVANLAKPLFHLNYSYYRGCIICGVITSKLYGQTYSTD